MFGISLLFAIFASLIAIILLAMPADQLIESAQHAWRMQQSGFALLAVFAWGLFFYLHRKCNA